MKRFLKQYFNIVDDLRRAAAKAEKAGLGSTAGHLEYYADQLAGYRPEKRWLCDASMTGKSSLKVWQKNTLRIAEQFDRCVFTRQEIEDLYDRLVRYAETQKTISARCNRRTSSLPSATTEGRASASALAAVFPSRRLGETTNTSDAMTALEKVHEYARQVRSGELPSCIMIRKAVERWYSDLSREDLIFDRAAFYRVVRFSSMLNHIAS